MALFAIGFSDLAGGRGGGGFVTCGGASAACGAGDASRRDMSINFTASSSSGGAVLLWTTTVLIRMADRWTPSEMRNAMLSISFSTAAARGVDLLGQLGHVRISRLMDTGSITIDGQ
jgi:hypothetical protein